MTIIHEIFKKATNEVLNKPVEKFDKSNCDLLKLYKTYNPQQTFYTLDCVASTDLDSKGKISFEQKYIGKLCKLI